MERTVNAIIEARRLISIYLESQEQLPHILPIIPAHTIQGTHIGLPLGIIKTIATETSTAIKIYRVNNLDSLMGYALQYNTNGVKSARVVYSAALNPCWSRLIIAKESMHVVLGKDGNRTENAEDARALISRLFKDMPSPEDLCESTKVEFAAIYGAIEILLPVEYHKGVREMMELGCSSLDIAKTFKMPEHLVELRFSSHINEAYKLAYKEMGLTSALPL